jgi:hypothetical protein
VSLPWSQPSAVTRYRRPQPNELVRSLLSVGLDARWSSKGRVAAVRDMHVSPHIPFLDASFLRVAFCGIWMNPCSGEALSSHAGGAQQLLSARPSLLLSSSFARFGSWVAVSNHVCSTADHAPLVSDTLAPPVGNCGLSPWPRLRTGDFPSPRASGALAP